MIQFQEFCDHLELTTKPEVEKAKAFIWFHFHTAGTNGCSIGEITPYFAKAHFADPNRTRLSLRLSADKEVAKRASTHGPAYSLTRAGLKRFDDLTSDIQASAKQEVLTPLSKKLTEAIAPIKSAQVRRFLGEAIGCLNGGFLRASVVLSWQGALTVLQEQTLATHLNAFNTEAASRQFIKKKIERIEHFQRIQESDQLTCFEAAGLISKAVKVALNDCLTRRNNCGHPNDFEIGEAQVAGQLETLIVHVFKRYS